MKNCVSTESKREERDGTRRMTEALATCLSKRAPLWEQRRARCMFVCMRTHLCLPLRFLLLREQDAETLKAVNGQVGTLVMDLEGQVLSSAGQLAGDVGEQAAEAVFSILQVCL